MPLLETRASGSATAYGLHAGASGAPPISDGLIVYLNAANPLSYSGSGNTWVNLAGSPNTSLTQGSWVFNSGFGGYLVMDTNDIANVGITIPPATSSTLNTWSAWILGGQNLVFGSNASSYGQFHFFGYVDSSNNTVSFGPSFYGGTSSDGGDSTSYPVTTGVPMYYTVVKTAAYKFDVYINGVKIFNQLNRQAYSSATLQLNISYATTTPSTGSYGEVHIYNRALSSTEVLENFNRTKPRFGI